MVKFSNANQAIADVTSAFKYDKTSGIISFKGGF
jgi:hypothetical protein